MLNFYDVPAPGPIGGSTVGMATPDFTTAQAAIMALWQPWFLLNNTLGTPQFLNINLDEIAANLGAEDFKAGMPLNVAKHYVRVYLDEKILTGDVVSQEFMEELPQYHRAAADAVLAVAVSLAVARKKGYYWWATKKAINKLFPFLGILWTKRWPQNKDGGPDYFMGRQFGDTAFYEIKGHAGLCKRPPKKFYNSKTQSINALFLVPPARHILSIAHFPADGISPFNVDVQWFNSSDETVMGEPTAIHKMQLLLIAVCQFATQLKIYGHDFYNFISYPIQGWKRHEEILWIEERARTEKIAVERTARHLFFRIYRLISWWESTINSDGIPELELKQVASILDRLVSHLNSLVDDFSEVDSRLSKSPFKTLYRYSNGIRIVSTEEGDSNDVILRDYG